MHRVDPLRRTLGAATSPGTGFVGANPRRLNRSNRSHLGRLPNLLETVDWCEIPGSAGEVTVSKGASERSTRLRFGRSRTISRLIRQKSWGSPDHYLRVRSEQYLLLVIARRFGRGSVVNAKSKRVARDKVSQKDIKPFRGNIVKTEQGILTCPRFEPKDRAGWAGSNCLPVKFGEEGTTVAEEGGTCQFCVSAAVRPISWEGRMGKIMQ